MAAATADRLVDGRDIAAVLRARHQRAGRLAVVHARRAERPGGPRVAVVASRRVGNAVTRNRAKRVLREAVRDLPWREATDVVLVARGPCGSSGMHAVRDEIVRLATELDALTPAEDAVA